MISFNVPMLLSDSTSKHNKTNIYRDLFQVVPSVFILIETKCNQYLKVEEQTAEIHESFQNTVILVLLGANV